MRRALLVLLILSGLAPGAWAPGARASETLARPQRIVSLNLCADPFLIALADRDQVAALTVYARDPGMSAVAAAAADYPASAGTAEEVLALHPDLIVASPYRKRETREMLARYGFPLLEIGPAENFAAILDQTRAIAHAIGQEARGEALIRTMQARVAAVGAQDVGQGAVALYYQRRGFATGTGTLVDEMLHRVGLTNLAAQLGQASIFRLTLEQVVVAKPTLLILNMEPTDTRDLGSEMLLHPALARVIPARHRLYLPESLTVCGGPSYPDAVERLRDDVAQALRDPN